MCYHNSISVGRIANIRLPTMFLMLILVLSTTSCDNEWPNDYCICQQGGTIGGWEDGDETDIHSKDSTAGFEVSLEHWNDTCKNDIEL